MKTSSFASRAISKLLGASLILAIVHFILIENILPEIYGTGPYWVLYLFLVPLSLLVVLICKIVYNADKTAVGRTYFIFVFIKMFASIGFLSPWIFWKDDYTLPMVHQFFCLFFPLLFVEIKVLIELLNPPLGENLKNDENQ